MHPYLSTFFSNIFPKLTKYGKSLLQQKLLLIESLKQLPNTVNKVYLRTDGLVEYEPRNYLTGNHGIIQSLTIGIEVAEKRKII